MLVPGDHCQKLLQGFPILSRRHQAGGEGHARGQVLRPAFQDFPQRSLTARLLAVRLESDHLFQPVGGFPFVGHKRNGLEMGPGLLRQLLLDQQPGQGQTGRRVLRFPVDDLLQKALRLLLLPGLQFDSGLRKELVDVRGTIGLEKPPDLGFRDGARELVDRLPLLEKNDLRNAADLEGQGQVLIFVGVDLGQQEGSGVFFGQLFQDGTQAAAGTAPGSPEVHQHRGGAGPLNDFRFKLLLGEVDHEFRTG